MVTGPTHVARRDVAIARRISLMSLISFNLHAVERNILIPIYCYFLRAPAENGHIHTCAEESSASPLSFATHRRSSERIHHTLVKSPLTICMEKYRGDERIYFFSRVSVAYLCLFSSARRFYVRSRGEREIIRERKEEGGNRFRRNPSQKGGY